jgi:hypothetical protein
MCNLKTETMSLRMCHGPVASQHNYFWDSHNTWHMNLFLFDIYALVCRHCQGYIRVQHKWNIHVHQFCGGIFSRGKGGRCVGLTTLPPSCADCLKKSGSLNLLEPSRSVKACNGIVLPFYISSAELTDRNCRMRFELFLQDFIRCWVTKWQC